MSSSEFLPAEIVAYLAAVNPHEHPVLARCREHTAAMPDAQMQISAEQGAFHATLLRAIAARRAFEIGVFTGYSTLVAALEMHAMHGDGAHILACDVSEEWTSRARAYWADAGLDHIIDLRLAPAIDTLDAALAAGQGGSYDFGFIDADKTGYDSYYERGLQLLRPGGAMMFDNVLWSGRLVDPDYASPEGEALKALALKAKADPRVHASMCAIGDGLLICVKH